EVLRDAIAYGNLASDDERTAFLAEKAGCYDDPARVFSFVLSIKNQDRDSTMFPYPDEHPETITNIARTRIADYGLHVFGERLLSEQITHLENRLASDIFSLSGKPTFLDTRYSVYPANSKGESALADIAALMANRESHRILIAGEAGCGKSTLLQNAYLRAARSFQNTWRESSVPLPIPVYLSLTGRGGTYDFSKTGLEDLWREVFPERAFPAFLSLDNLSFDYYIDALDEACDGIAAAQVKTVVEGLVKAPNAHSMVLSTRKHLVKDLELYGLVGRFSHRFEIYGWDDENIRDYIRHHTGTDDAARILSAIHGIQSHRGDSGYFAPLLIKLVLWNIQQANGVDAFFDRTNGCAHFTIGLLLRYTVEALCRQELSKKPLFSDDAVQAHLQVLFDFCWRLHCASDKRIRGNELLEESRCAVGIAEDPTPFIRHFYDLSREFRPTSIHLQFEEYFLAEKALALLGSRESTGELYRNAFFLSSEANRMIADLISIEPSDKKAALLDNLFRQYRATKNHSQRIMILYLMPRLVMTEKVILPRLTAFMKKELHKHLKRKNHLEVIVILNLLTQLEDFR
ncbi:MAG: NACHT domain-containing protein, partial [Eubacteriales bacterium]